MFIFLPAVQKRTVLGENWDRGDGRRGFRGCGCPSALAPAPDFPQLQFPHLCNGSCENACLPGPVGPQPVALSPESG